MEPTQSLSINNFLSTYAFDPRSDSLSLTDRKIALGWTIGLGIISLGLFHLGLAIVHGAKKLFCAKKIESSPQELQDQAGKIDNLKINSSNPVVRLDQQQLDIDKKQSLSAKKFLETDRAKEVEQLKALNPTKMNFIYAAGILTEHPIHSWGLRKGREGDIYCVFKKGEMEEDYVEFCLTKPNSLNWETVKNQLKLKEENRIQFKRELPSQTDNTQVTVDSNKPNVSSQQSHSNHKSFSKSEKAKLLIQEAQVCVQDLKNEMKFSTVERFKKVKTEAKKLFNKKSTTPDIKLQMEKIIQQYIEIVDASEVLTILKKLSEEIRKPDSTKENLMTYRFASLISGDQLRQSYLTQKDKWKKEWETVRQNFWNGSLEAESFLKEGKKITFITGSQASSLPLILRIGQLAPAISLRPALVPTGQLLKHNIVPLSGELGHGITKNGINQHALSGMELSGLKICLTYASSKGFQFSADQELDFLMDIHNYNHAFLDMTIPRCRVAVLRLLRMGAKTENYPAIKNLIQDTINKLLLSKAIENWKKYANLIGAICKNPGEPASDNLQIGQMVAIPINGSNSLKYGIITNKHANGRYTIQFERSGETKALTNHEITVISKNELEETVQEILPLSNDEIYRIEKQFQGLEEKLQRHREMFEDILKLFDTVEPITFSPSEMDLILNPFPLVWVSVTLNKWIPVHSDIYGERAVGGKATLGNDIQVVFTNRENIPKLENLVKDLGVKVLSFEAAHLILEKANSEKAV